MKFGKIVVYTEKVLKVLKDLNYDKETDNSKKCSKKLHPGDFPIGSYLKVKDSTKSLGTFLVLVSESLCI